MNHNSVTRGPSDSPFNNLDSELEAAVAEVDRTLIRWMLSLTPEERLRAATRFGRTIEKLRRARA